MGGGKNNREAGERVVVLGYKSRLRSRRHWCRSNTETLPNVQYSYKVVYLLYR